MEDDTRERRAIERGFVAVAAAGLVVAVYLVLALALGGGSADGPGGAAGERAGEGAGDETGDETGDPPGEVPGDLIEERAGHGSLELGGTVTDAGGHAVANVAVIAEPEPLAEAKGQPAAVASAVPTADERAAARTATDGSFTLRGLVPGRHRLRVEGRGVLAAEVRFVDVPGPVMRVVVSRRAEVSGRVTDGGAAAAGVQVRLLAAGAPAPLAAVTDADGRFAFADLAEGRFRVWAARGDRAAPSRAADRVGPGPFEPVALALGPAAIVAGRVVDGSTGRGVAAHVTLVSDDPDEPPRATTSAADGSFRADGVPPGRWTADAFAPGYVSADAVRFAAGTGYAPSIALRRGGVLAGRVVDGAGAPIAGAQVMARAEEGGSDVSAEAVARRLGTGGAGWDSTLALASAAASGAGLVTATGLRFVPRGELGVVVGPLPFPPAAGSTAAVRIALPDRPAAAVTDAPALPVDPALEPRFTTDRDGHFRLTGLAPGRYRALAAHPSFADGAAPARAIELDTAIDDLEIELGGGLILHGTVVDQGGAAVSGAAIEARSKGVAIDPRYTVTGADGRYRLGPIGGDVVLEVSAAGRGLAWREVAVGPPGRAPVLRREDFTLVQADAAIEGRVTDASGFAVAGARVKVIDQGGGRAARAAVTDAAGRFRLAGVVAGSHRVRVEHADYPPAELDAAAGAGNELRLVAGVALEVEVRVRASGAPIAGAQVIARGPDRAVRRAVAPRGRVALAALAPGEWTVEASARGYAAGTAEVDLAPRARPDLPGAAIVRVELARGAILAGVVRDRDGQRIAGAAITAGRAHTTSDADGRFRLTDAPSGAITVEAEKDGERGALDLDLTPGQELVTVELRLE